MSKDVQVQLDRTQRDLLLRGLSFVRSSVLLGVREPSPEVTSEREGELQKIEDLIARLNSSPSASEPVHA